MQVLHSTLLTLVIAIRSLPTLQAGSMGKNGIGHVKTMPLLHVCYIPLPIAYGHKEIFDDQSAFSVIITANSQRHCNAISILS
jgi:hypothetical protein